MNRAIFTLAILLGLPSSGAAQSATAIPSRAEILALMHRVNTYQIENPVSQPSDRYWMRATWYTGVMEAWKATHDDAYFKQAFDWGKRNDWQIGTEPLGANRLFPSETWAELYLAKRSHGHNDTAMLTPTETSLATPEPNSPAGATRWYLDHGRPYCDSLYGAAIFPMLYRATGNEQYLTTMRAFFEDITDTLWDDEAGLYYRDPSYIGERTPRGRKVFWSRGNGWVFAGISRILDYLPKNDPERPRLLATYKRMAAELIKLQSGDGFWRANLTDADDIPNPESSGTGFFCFGLAWGINNHILPRKTYLPATLKAYAALTSAVSPEGMVQWGQPIDERPNATKRSSSHEFVTGAFLMASSQVYLLSK